MNHQNQLVKGYVSRLKRRLHRYFRLPPWPPLGRVRFENLRRLTPIGRNWGFGRGLPIDRYYIERFLVECSMDIKGNVLEIGDNTYTLKFGGDRVTKSDILHVTNENIRATYIADLTQTDNLPPNVFDCIICTQTLQQIFEVKNAIRNIHHILKPGSTVLVTFPGICKIDGGAMSKWGDYWRFTTLSARHLFEDVFLKENIEVKAFGNVLTSVAFLHGIAAEELHGEELEYNDDEYQLLITVRAVKRAEKI
jgi:SAM-dependent methyltransferase